MKPVCPANEGDKSLMYSTKQLLHNNPYAFALPDLYTKIKIKWDYNLIKNLFKEQISQ